MKNLVTLRGKNIVTNSLIIAEGTDNEHRSIIRLIQRYEEKFERWGKMRFVDLKSENPLGGRPTTVALLNEPQATFLITLLRNTDIVLDFKSELVDQFYKMREILLRHQNAEWLEIRRAGIKTNKKMTAAIQQDLIPLAREQGSTTDDKFFYINYQRAVNKAAGVSPKCRDALSISQLYEVDKLQDIATCSIKGLASKNEPYKKIYSDTKQTLENYAQISLISQRFLN